LLNNAEHLLIL